MPAAAKRVCNHAGCPFLAPAGARFCQVHQPEEDAAAPPAWRTTQGSAHSRGYGAQWRRLRAFILRRDPLCCACERVPATEVDHITPKAAGGSDDETNLQGLCTRCHRQKTAKTRVGSRGGGRRR